jgi:type IV pilus assembly protein PilY1
VAYFTTYQPSSVAVPDPCEPDLGTARLYAVDYKTGEAVLNYDTSNDSISTTNKRAISTPGQVLVRSDRLKTLGSGIPSGIVLIINPNGGLKALIGVGGASWGNPKGWKHYSLIGDSENPRAKHRTDDAGYRK